MQKTTLDKAGRNKSDPGTSSIKRGHWEVRTKKMQGTTEQHAWLAPIVRLPNVMRNQGSGAEEQNGSNEQQEQNASSEQNEET